MAQRNVIQWPAGLFTPASTTRGRTGVAQSLQEEINSLFSDFFGQGVPARWEESSVNFPAIDVVENEKELRLTAELPGITLEDVEIIASLDSLTIKGEKKQENVEEKEGYLRRERSYGNFQRRVILPETADIENISATAKDGIVQVVIPKRELPGNKTRKVLIKKG